MRIIGLAGYSGSGKTTLLGKAIPRLIARGLTVSTLKHAHHEFDVDQPGKDSHTHRMAGATEVLVASSRRFALVHELRGEAEPPLAALLGSELAPVDMVLIEGYKREPHPKLEVHRAAVGMPLLGAKRPCDRGDRIGRSPAGGAVPVLDLNDVEGIVEILISCACRSTPYSCVRGSPDGAADR